MFVSMKFWSRSNMGHIGSKLGPTVKLKENLVSNLEVTVLTRFLSNLARMLVSMKSRSRSNMVHMGSKTRSN